MMTSAVTICHNARRGTSRNTLAAIREAGREPVTINYLINPPARDTLAVRSVHTGAREPVTRRGGARRHGMPRDYCAGTAGSAPMSALPGALPAPGSPWPIAGEPGWSWKSGVASSV
jgi:hypothetical protein